MPFTPDVLIWLIKARFYGHVSSVSCHRHRKLWNVEFSFWATIIFTHLQGGHQYKSPRPLTLFFEHNPITHAGRLVFSQKRSKHSWLLCLFPSEKRPTHRWHKSFDQQASKEIQIYSPQSARKLPSIFFLQLKIKGGGGGGGGSL